MKHKRIPFSKLVVALAVIVAVCFIVWSCCEMHRLNDLTPVDAIGDRIINMMFIVISAYMWRAKQSDLYELEIKKAGCLGKAHRVPRVPEDQNEMEMDEVMEAGEEE